MEIEQKEINRTEPCNTERAQSPQKPQQPPQYIYWCFTWNNYEIEQIEILERILEHECDWYVFQEEKAPTTGTPHLQGTLKLTKRRRLSEMKKINYHCRWEPTAKISASLVYCSAEHKRTGQIWAYGIEVPEPIELCEPYGWQLDVINIAKDKPDKRTIHWYWEPDGNIGKSELCKWLVVNMKAVICNGKANDIYHAIVKARYRKIIVVDVPRENIDYVNYTALENVKNGLIFSGKYDSQQLVFNNPHVFVFANEEPRYHAMSADRWHVVRITRD